MSRRPVAHKRAWHSALSLCGWALAAALMSQPAWAAITVDGILSDWGVSPGPYSNGPSQWTPNSGIAFVQEDQNPTVSFLNPGFGGQLFDVEAIYFTQETTTAYFAVASGFPLAGVSGNLPGDLAIDFGSNGSYEFGVKTTGTHTVYGNATWIAPTSFPGSFPYALASGTPLGLASFGYQPFAYAATGHYVFEMGIPVALFGTSWPSTGDLDFTVHWTMSCGNDELDLRVLQHRAPPPPLIPEPASFLLVGIGWLGLSLRRRPFFSS